MKTRTNPGRNGAGDGTALSTSLKRTSLLLLALATGLASQAPLAAQDVTVRERQECRCVDRDGNEIENCTCMRTPRVDMIAPRVAGILQRRSRIGVYIDYRQGASAEAEGGALITEVMEDGPAEEAGLREGDLVLRVDGHRLSEPLEDLEAEEAMDLDQSVAVQRFARLVGDLEPGQPAEFEILRDGERMTLTVTPESARGMFVFGLGDAPRILMRGGEDFRFDMPDLRDEELRRELESRALRERMRMPEVGVWRFDAPEGAETFEFRVDSVGERGGFAFFDGDPCFSLARSRGDGFALLARSGDCVDGVEMLALNPDLAEYFQADEGSVLVTEVAETSTLGLRAGDVLLAIDGREVRDPDHARRILTSYRMDEDIRLRVLRQGREIEVLGRRRDG